MRVFSPYLVLKPASILFSLLSTASPAFEDALLFNMTRPCDSFDYDRSFWRRTIIQEWDLVCGKKDLRKLTQQVTFFGLLVGVVASGLISDR